MLALLEASPWYRSGRRKPVHGHAYFSEATDEAALFTFAEANRALSSGPPRRASRSARLPSARWMTFLRRADRGVQSRAWRHLE